MKSLHPPSSYCGLAQIPLSSVDSPLLIQGNRTKYIANHSHLAFLPFHIGPLTNAMISVSMSRPQMEVLVESSPSCVSLLFSEGASPTSRPNVIQVDYFICS
jgi:hypothetical protein